MLQTALRRRGEDQAHEGPAGSIGRLNELYYRRTAGLLYASAGTLKRRADLVALPDGTVVAWNGWYSQPSDEVAQPLDEDDWENFRVINGANMLHSMGYKLMCEGNRLAEYITRELEDSRNRDLAPDNENHERISTALMMGLWVIDVVPEIERVLALREIPRNLWAT